MGDELLGGGFPVLLQAGCQNVQMFLKGVLNSAVGYITSHKPEPIALGLGPGVALAQIGIRAGVHDHLVKGRVQLVEILVVALAFAAGAFLGEGLKKAVKLLLGD